MQTSTEKYNSNIATTALVTGAAGFIGSHVAQALLAQNVSVIGVDNLDDFYDPTLKRANVQELQRTAPSPEAFEFLALDIRDEAGVARVMRERKPDLIVHLAARAGVRPSIEQPALYADVNVVGTLRLLEAARACACERFLLASSSSVYGEAERAPFAETHSCLKPVSPYAATKRSCELLAHTYHHLYGMKIACLRFFTVFGPRQRPDLAISRFMRLAAQGEPIPMFGDGSTSRDYTYIDDIVAGVLSAAREIDAHGYRIWNLGGAHPVTLRDMIDAIARTTGKALRVNQLPMQPGDVTRTYADLSRSERELGYSPSTTFDEGLANHWTWLQQHDSPQALIA